jgi:DNA-binding HxlR family transcriptional regulator
MLRNECPVSLALRVIAGKWKPLILRELKSGNSLRYGQLLRRIPEASQKVLTSQLRQLERDGLVERTIYHETILRTQYALTPYGRKHSVPRSEHDSSAARTDRIVMSGPIPERMDRPRGG